MDPGGGYLVRTAAAFDACGSAKRLRGVVCVHMRTGGCVQPCVRMCAVGWGRVGKEGTPAGRHHGGPVA